MVIITFDNVFKILFLLTMPIHCQAVRLWELRNSSCTSTFSELTFKEMFGIVKEFKFQSSLHAINVNKESRENLSGGRNVPWKTPRPLLNSSWCKKEKVLNCPWEAGTKVLKGEQATSVEGKIAWEIYPRNGTRMILKIVRAWRFDSSVNTGGSPKLLIACTRVRGRNSLAAVKGLKLAAVQP